MALAVASPLDAEVVRITISSRAPALNGQAFGAAGPYEDIRGVAFGEIDPRDPKNAVITDIELAPKNARGMVEYRTTFTLRKPVDMTQVARRAFLQHRQSRQSQRAQHWHVGGDPGDGFLYRLGHVVLWSGWQGDMPIASVSAEQEGIDVPIAKNADGSAVTGPGLGALRQRRRRGQHAVAAWRGGPDAGDARHLEGDADLGDLRNAGRRQERRRRDRQHRIGRSPTAGRCRSPARPIPRASASRTASIPTLLYELVYTAKDPYVLGVGMAAMRDVVSFFRYAAADAAGTANPIAGAVPHVIAMGNSQSGRFAKAFVNLGFNEDERGRIVWDGLNARIAGMLGSFNTRFAQPGDIAELYDPGAEGPLWWGDYDDSVRGRPAWGLLHRCTATKTCPKITETYGGPELWYSRGGVGIAGTTGTEDLPLPDNVRRYYHPGTTHGGGPGGFKLGTASTTAGVMANNPNPERETDRALYVALVDWVVQEHAAAAQRVSARQRRHAGAATRRRRWAGRPFPNTPKPDGVVNPVLDYDYGPAFRYNDNSGVIANVPPPIKRRHPDARPQGRRRRQRDRRREVAAAAHAAWHLHRLESDRERAAEGPRSGRSPAATFRSRRPRPSAWPPAIRVCRSRSDIASAWSYVSTAQTQADALVKQRLLLPEDAMRLLKQLLNDVEAGGLFEK